MGRTSFAGLVLLPLFYLIPAVILYFTVKLAVKHAIRELKNENIL